MDVLMYVLMLGFWDGAVGVEFGLLVAYRHSFVTEISLGQTKEP